jgi:hypothetical protein
MEAAEMVDGKRCVARLLAARLALLVAACAVAVALLVGSASAATGAKAGQARAVHRVVRAAPHVAGEPNLGPNVYVFTPSMSQADIQSTLDSIADQQVPASAQFSTARYALLFEPGTYGSTDDPLTFQVGYYTEVAGLGISPDDVTINGSVDVYNQCDSSNSCVALNNFWRSLSNLTINVAGQTGCESGADFWAVSQASPMRRVNLTGGNLSLMDYCNGSPDYASGGFIADSAFSGGTVINGSQQQFFVRNSDLDGWSNAVWNQVFVGDSGAPATTFAGDSGDPGGPASYTTLANTPISEEEPFLQADDSGNYGVFVPSPQTNSSGASWDASAGTMLPISKFFIATPSTSVGQINLELLLGKNLILTPGVYDLKAPIEVTRKNTVVLGMGFATLVPQNGTAAINVLQAQGVKLSGLIIDAGPKNSSALMRIGTILSPRAANLTDPTLLQDVFFRVGGATAGSATTSLVVDASNVILDDIWAWRADHGNGVGWTDNTAAHGLVVNGNNVTAYGLAVEHYQQSQVIWNGQNGEDVFFQSEMPYDPPSQAAWNESATVSGYPSFEIGPQVKTFTGYGMGAYSFFNQGVPIEASMGFQAPDTPGVSLDDLLTVFLNGSGGIQSVINGTGSPVSSTFGGPSDVVSYP